MRQPAQPVEETSERPKGKKTKPKRAFTGEQTGSGEGTSTPVSSTESTNNKKRKYEATSGSGKATGFQKQEPRQPAAVEDDSSLTNKEFAKQYSQARNGTQLASPSKPGQSKKERRANKNVAQMTSDVNSPQAETEASSTTSGDADDDLSSTESPEVGAVSSGTAKAGDVRDMMEKQTPGPSVLRLTGDLKKPQTKTVAKPFEVAETKKQRQARLKREAQKLANEEAEKVRRQLEEKQRRGARMAEGTSAQTKVNSWKPPMENTWFARDNAPKEDPVESGATAFEELDTREQGNRTKTPGVNSVSAEPLPDITNGSVQQQQLDVVKQLMGIAQAEAAGAPNHESRTSGTNGLSANVVDPSSSTQSNKSWADDMNSMSEEEQMKKFDQLRQDDAWNTVPSKKEKKKAGKTGEASSVDTATTPTAKSRGMNGAARGSTTNSGPQRTESSNRFANAFGAEQQDSEWTA